MKIAPSVQSKVPVPTREGLATLALTGFVFLLATNLMAVWLFFLVAFLLAVLLVGTVSARGAVRAVRLEAGAADPAVEGGEVAVGEERAARFLSVIRHPHVILVGEHQPVTGHAQPPITRFMVSGE